MINTQKFYKCLLIHLFLFNLWFPAHDYAAEPMRQFTQFTSTTNSTRMETATESIVGDTAPPVGASHILPGQKFDSVIRDSTRIHRSIKKMVSEKHHEEPIKFQTNT